MTVESVTYISDLNATYPAGSDAKSEGDQHIRNLKTGIKTTFPNISGAVTPTHTELNFVDGVTSAIQTQLNAKSDVSGETYSGAHDFTGATTTVATPTLNAQAATKAYVDGISFSSSLPGQTGNAGRVVSTNGTSASWQGVFGAWVNLTATATLTNNAAHRFATTGQTYTTPASASLQDGDCLVLMNTGTDKTNVIAANAGQTIMGAASQTYDLAGTSIVLKYVSALTDWRIL